MLTITNPRGVTFVTNQYDANGRVTEQTHADGGVYRFAYALDGNGDVTQTDVTDPRAAVDRTSFNAAGYCTAETVALGLPEAQSHDVDTRCPVESGPRGDRCAESPDGVYLRRVRATA